ncbi:hypothetical protein Tco_0957627 [Tanacetum coccineum]
MITTSSKMEGRKPSGLMKTMDIMDSSLCRSVHWHHTGPCKCQADEISVRLGLTQPDLMSDELVIAEMAKLRRFCTPVVNGCYL